MASFFAKSNLRMSLFCLALGTAGLPLLTSGCAPSQAQAIRQGRNTTIGLLGASYRPTGTFGVGVTGQFGSDEFSVDKSKKERATSDTDKANLRDVAERSEAVAPFVHYYPWATSAFFVGAGARFSTLKYTFEEENSQSTALAPSYSEVKYNVASTEVHMPLGWHWIWESGFTAMLDFGPRMNVAYKGRFTDDGSESGVSADQRDRTAESIDRVNRNGVRFGGTGLVGWSF